MKELNKLYEELNARDDFRVVQTAMEGGGGIFTKGSLRKATVIWSYTDGWEHVSVNGKNRTPTWEEMCMIKDMFWEPNETCVEYHPAEKDYVNNLDYCLHIWKPIEEFSGKLPVPDSFLVGIKGAHFRK